MAISAMNWVRENTAVYIGNATTNRDFRSQLRGSKPVLLWTAYLGLLILVMALAYNGIVERNEGSVATVQRQLGDFYMEVMALLGGLIALVTPSLTATTVVMERRRKSLDLVFSSPVTLKYYLVGKMLSSLRYTWMLLILALPITAVCVVMGGATWTDVIGAYILLTGASLVFTAIGLLVSVLAPTVVSAVLWTYFTIICYCVVCSSFGSIFTIGVAVMGRSSMEQSWFVGVSPFLAAMAAPTYTTIHGFQVPNWALDLLYSVLMCKILVLGAASALSPFRAAETKSLRMHVLVYLALLGAVLPLSMRSAFADPASPVDFVPLAAAWIMAFGAFAIPTIACFARDADRRNRPDGWFNFLRTLIGTPSGALPFVLLCPIAFYVGIAATVRAVGGAWWDSKLAASLLWALAYMCFWWSWARLLSCFNKPLRVARTMVGALFIAVFLLPLPVLQSLAGYFGTDDPMSKSVWRLHILYPVLQGKADTAEFVFYAKAMLIGALCVTALGILSALAGPMRPRASEPR